MTILSRAAAVLFCLGLVCTATLLFVGEPLDAAGRGNPEVRSGAPGRGETVSVDEGPFRSVSDLVASAASLGWKPYAGTTVACGLLWLLCVGLQLPGKPKAANATRTQRVRRAAPPKPEPVQPSTPGQGPSPSPDPPVNSPRPIRHDLLNEFEVSWKTFATYTEDLLHRKLKEIESAPVQGVQDLREQIGHLSRSLDDVKQGLALARHEVKDTSRGLVQQVASLIQHDAKERSCSPAPPPEILRKIEGDLERTGSTLAMLQELMERLQAPRPEDRGHVATGPTLAELQAIESQWQGKVRALEAGLEEARNQARTLVAEVARLSRTEESLRLDLAEGEVRAKVLEQDVAAERSKREAAVHDKEAMEEREGALSRELQAAGERVQKAEEQLSAAAELRMQLEAALEDRARRQESLDGELAGLRREFDELKQQYARGAGSAEGRETVAAASPPLARAPEPAALDAVEARFAVLEKRCGDAEARTLELSSQLKAREEELLEAREALDALRSEADSLRVRGEGLDRARVEQVEETTRLRAGLDAAQVALRDARREVDSVRDLHDEEVQGLRARREELEAQASAAMAEAERLREALRETEDLRAEVDALHRFQTVLIEGGMPFAVVAADDSLKVFTWNAAAEALWGRGADQVLGKSLEGTGLPAELLDLVQRTLRTGEAVDLSLPMTAASGAAPRLVRACCRPVADASGGIIAAVLGVLDATPVVDGEEDALCHARFSEDLIQSIPVGLVVLDDQRRVVGWNPRAAEMLGISEEDAVGHDIFSLETPLSKERFRAYFEKVCKDGTVRRIRLRMESGGSSVRYALTQSPFLDGSARRGTILLLEQEDGVLPGA